MSPMRTPFYLLDEARLVENLAVVRRLRERSGARLLLALKCFASWAVFDLLRTELDGTTSSSLYEVRLGAEEFGKETHAYSVAWSRDEVLEAAALATTVIFNSASQLLALGAEVAHRRIGVRVNPGVSHSAFDLADPARPGSRLGIADPDELGRVIGLVDGLMFHFNCENEDPDDLARSLSVISRRFGDALDQVAWVSLGGGIAFTAPGYPVDRLAAELAGFAARHQVQVYLEPGEAVVTGAGELVTTVLDVMHRGVDVAVVDAAVETHLPDALIYGCPPELSSPGPGAHPTVIAGRTCLAGDVFGEYRVAEPLQVGDEVRFADAAAYTMVKANWFNGIRRPSIVVRRRDGSTELVREFGYEEFKACLS